MMTSGHTNCTYIIIAKHEGKEPVSIGTFTLPRAATAQETEAAAKRGAEADVHKFYGAHLPDGTPRPTVVDVRLGHMTFIPDDYEWRRT